MMTDHVQSAWMPQQLSGSVPATTAAPVKPAQTSSWLLIAAALSAGLPSWLLFHETARDMQPSRGQLPAALQAACEALLADLASTGGLHASIQ